MQKSGFPKLCHYVGFWQIGSHDISTSSKTAHTLESYEEHGLRPSFPSLHLQRKGYWYFDSLEQPNSFPNSLIVIKATNAAVVIIK